MGLVISFLRQNWCRWPMHFSVNVHIIVFSLLYLSVTVCSRTLTIRYNSADPGPKEHQQFDCKVTTATHRLLSKKDVGQNAEMFS